MTEATARKYEPDNDPEWKRAELFGWYHQLDLILQSGFDSALEVVRGFSKAEIPEDQKEYPAERLSWQLGEITGTPGGRASLISFAARMWEHYIDDPALPTVIESKDYPEILEDFEAAATYPYAFLRWLENQPQTEWSQLTRNGVGLAISVQLYPPEWDVEAEAAQATKQ